MELDGHVYLKIKLLYSLSMILLDLDKNILGFWQPDALNKNI